MKLLELIQTVDNLRYNDSPSYKVIQSKQKELLEIVAGSTDIKNINSKVINKLIETLRAKGNTNTTINSKLAYISSLLTYALVNELITSKPHIPTFKITSTKDRYLDDDEISLLLVHCKEHNLWELYKVILIGLNTGMRINEILSLTPDSIDNGYIRIWTNKTNKPHSIPMNSVVAEILKDDVTFNLNYAQIQHQFKKVTRELNLSDVTLHTLRHTFCSKLVQKNIPLTTIQQLANHKSYTTTLRYAHLANKQLEDAVNCL